MTKSSLKYTHLLILLFIYDTIISYCQLLQLRLLTTRFILMPAIWSLSALQSDLKVSSLKCYVHHVFNNKSVIIHWLMENVNQNH